jgi:hypothetical protein
VVLALAVNPYHQYGLLQEAREVLIFKLTVSGFDIVSDGSTAFELQHMGSPLGEMTRYVIFCAIS